MPACAYCGDEMDEFAFECNYCGEHHCRSHRLPERHDCTQISIAQPPSAKRQESGQGSRSSRKTRATEFIDRDEIEQLRNVPDEKTYSTVEIKHTVGTTKDPEYLSSPDVAPDGSLRESEVPDDLTDEERDTDTPQRFTGRTVLIVTVLLLVLAVGAAWATGLFDPQDLVEMI